jgi:succinate dehydrogenase / fumarate reductase membrane anchor subunit
MTTTTRQIEKPRSYEVIAWKWMRYSAILLIPLVWGHVLIQDVIVGVHAIDLDYVVMRWASLGWQVYDILLLGFAFAHGVNGLRQVLNDFVHGKQAQKILAWALFVFWLMVSAMGAIAIIASASKHLAAL